MLHRECTDVIILSFSFVLSLVSTISLPKFTKLGLDRSQKLEFKFAQSFCAVLSLITRVSPKKTYFLPKAVYLM